MFVVLEKYEFEYRDLLILIATFGTRIPTKGKNRYDFHRIVFHNETAAEKDHDGRSQAKKIEKKTGISG